MRIVGLVEYQVVIVTSRPDVNGVTSITRVTDYRRGAAEPRRRYHGRTAPGLYRRIVILFQTSSLLLES